MAGLIIEMTGNEFKHHTPDTKPSSRTGHTAPKGSHYFVYDIQGSMYKIREHTGQYVWISKTYTKIIQQGTPIGVGRDTNPSQTTTSGSKGSTSKAGTVKAPNNLDWVIAVGAGFLFLMILGKLVKKL